MIPNLEEEVSTSVGENTGIIVVKTKNQFEKPTYELMKNNYIKNPTIDYRDNNSIEDKEIDVNCTLCVEDNKVTTYPIRFYVNYDTKMHTATDDYFLFAMTKESENRLYVNPSTTSKRIEVLSFYNREKGNSEVATTAYLFFKVVLDRNNEYVLDISNTGTITYTGNYYKTKREAKTTEIKNPGVAGSMIFSQFETNSDYVSSEITSESIEKNITYNSYLNDKNSLTNEEMQTYSNKYGVSINNGIATIRFCIPIYSFLYSKIKVDGSYYTHTIENMALVNFTFKAPLRCVSNGETLNYIKDKTISTDAVLNTNELISYSRAVILCSDVAKKYKNGRRVVKLSVYNDNYYDTNNNLVYNKGSGDTIKVGDLVIPYEYKNNVEVPVGTLGLGEPIVYKVTSSEIEYNGVIVNRLTLVEEKGD